MYQPPRKVAYDPAKGIVSVSVVNGYATQGAFSLHITDGNVMKKIGDGNFNDQVPDIFPIPLPPAALPGWMLIIIGSYSPAAMHTQISADYRFIQQADCTDTEAIRETAPYLSTHHDFTF